MEQIITVARVQPPAPGKKQYAVYDTNDKRWGLHNDDASAFAPGATYKIWDWQSSMFNGKQYDTIKSGNYQQMGGAAPAPRGGFTPAPQGAAPQRQYVAPDDVTRRRDIFVCGALNNILGNSSTDPKLKDNGQELTRLVWRLRKVFDYGLGPAAQDPSFSTARTGPGATPEQQAEAALGYGRVADNAPPDPALSKRRDMDDEIPF